MDESELQEIVMDISRALDAPTEIYWDGIHVTSWQEAGKALPVIVGILVVALFFYFALVGV